MKTFKPTYLYIKQHSVTGLLYFGKTTQNPEKYKGSGKYWNRHCNKHNKDHIVTLWYCLFLTPEDCETFALNFSKQENITESTSWANLKNENGLEGGSDKGKPQGPHTEQAKQNISKAKKGVKIGPMSAEHKAKIAAARLGHGHTEEAKANMNKNRSPVHCANISAARKNKPRSLESRAKQSASRKGVKRGSYKKLAGNAS